MINIKGKWAFITGASRGIGRLSALYLANMGCNLVLHSRTLASCQKTLQDVKGIGVEAFCVEAELSRSEEVMDMLKKIDESGVDIDFVLNNAGYQIGYHSDYLNTPWSDYPASFAINTIAPLMITTHFLTKMERKGFGRIVNTTSGIALQPEQSAYSASKAALNKVTIDLGFKYNNTNIMINLTDPGWCQTDMGGPSAPNTPESALPGVLLGLFLDDQQSGRLFSAQEYAGMALQDALSLAVSVKSPY